MNSLSFHEREFVVSSNIHQRRHGDAFNRTKYLEINQTNKAASAFSRTRCSPSRHLFHQIKAIIGHSYKSKTP